MLSIQCLNKFITLPSGRLVCFMNSLLPNNAWSPLTLFLCCHFTLYHFLLSNSGNALLVWNILPLLLAWAQIFLLTLRCLYSFQSGVKHLYSSLLRPDNTSLRVLSVTKRKHFCIRAFKPRAFAENSPFIASIINSGPIFDVCNDMHHAIQRFWRIFTWFSYEERTDCWNQAE